MPWMTKRGARGISLDQLEKDLEEAFALLDSMGVSNVCRTPSKIDDCLVQLHNMFQIKRSPSSRMNGLEEAINSFSVSKRSINNGRLETLEAK